MATEGLFGLREPGPTSPETSEVIDRCNRTKPSNWSLNAEKSASIQLSRRGATMGQRFTLVKMAVCAVLLTAACGGSGTQGDAESGADGGDCSQVFTDEWRSPAISWILYADSYPTDWVTYAEQVSVVTVVQEIVDPNGTVDDIDRKVVLRVDRVLWARSNERSLTGTFEMRAAGWWDIEGEGVIPARFGDRPRLEVGCQYVMPLVWWPSQDSEGKWTQLTEATLWVAPDGSLQGGYDGRYQLHRSSQDPIEQVAEELTRTPPSRYYEAFKHLPAEERLNAIGRAEGIAEIEAVEAIKEARSILRRETDDPPLLLYGVTHDGRVGSRSLSSEYGEDLLYPYDDLSDWVTYAEQVAVVTVIGVAEGTERHYPGSASIIERQVELRIDEMLWTSPGAHSIAPGTVELRETAGWASLGNQRIPLVPSEGRRFEPGHRYVVPLVREVRQVLAQSGNEVVIEDFWVLLHRNAVLEIADDGTLFTGPEGNMRLSSSGSPRTFRQPPIVD